MSTPFSRPRTSQIEALIEIEVLIVRVAMNAQDPVTSVGESSKKLRKDVASPNEEEWPFDGNDYY